jgi:hypothetical protein
LKWYATKGLDNEGMKRIISIGGALAFAAAAVSGGTGTAQADPYDCTTWHPNVYDAAALCTNGTGEYRAYTRCDRQGPDYDAYGSWVRVGQTSVAKCNRSPHDRGAKSVGIQVR